MNNLEAVNTMLRAIGQVPVRDIPDSGISDSRMALEVLEEYTKELQSEGYEFNTNEGEELTPNSEDEILVPSDTIRITAHYRSARVVARKGKLYDLHEDTYKFTEPFKVDRVFITDYSDLPVALQRYVVIRAARVFANRTIGAGEQNGYNQEDETRARISWLNTLAQDADLNLLSTSRGVRGRVFRPSHAVYRGNR